MCLNCLILSFHFFIQFDKKIIDVAIREEGDFDGDGLCYTLVSEWGVCEIILGDDSLDMGLASEWGFACILV